jgi:hypothetical protein
MMPTSANPQGNKGRTMVSNPLIGTWRLLSWENRSVDDGQVSYPLGKDATGYIMSVPGAFGRYGVIFGSAYFVVQLLQVILYALATGREPERRAILRLAPGTVGAPALLIVAGFLDGFAQGALWAIALAVGYGVAYVRGVSGFRIHPGHFAERHGLIVII